MTLPYRAYGMNKRNDNHNDNLSHNKEKYI